MTVIFPNKLPSGNSITQIIMYQIWQSGWTDLNFFFLCPNVTVLYKYILYKVDVIQSNCVVCQFKGHVSYCYGHPLHFFYILIFLRNHWGKWSQTWNICNIGFIQKFNMFNYVSLNKLTYNPLQSLWIFVHIAMSGQSFKL